MKEFEFKRVNNCKFIAIIVVIVILGYIFIAIWGIEAVTNFRRGGIFITFAIAISFLVRLFCIEKGTLQISDGKLTVSGSKAEQATVMINDIIDIRIQSIGPQGKAVPKNSGYIKIYTLDKGLKSFFSAELAGQHESLTPFLDEIKEQYKFEQSAPKRGWINYLNPIALAKYPDFVDKLYKQMTRNNIYIPLIVALLLGIIGALLLLCSPNNN